MNIFKLKNRNKILAWSFYDFANQPFTTIIVTFIYSAFFIKEIAYNEDNLISFAKKAMEVSSNNIISGKSCSSKLENP